MTQPRGAPRLRVFAGPNGSGKSTLKAALKPEWLGSYVNADEIERQLRTTGRLDLSEWPIDPQPESLRDFLKSAVWLRRVSAWERCQQWRVQERQIVGNTSDANSYDAAVLADWLRHALLDAHVSFTFETVMSSDDKVEFLRRAQSVGYRTYLYFVATEDVSLNLDRIRLRVAQGGHDVPEAKVRTRYLQTLGNLRKAVRYTNRAYLFDNSEQSRVLVAEITDASGVLLHRPEAVPDWVNRYLLRGD